MHFSLDDALGIHAQALKVHAKRLEVLGTNIANADTPNYKARDIDFRAALKYAVEPSTAVPLATTQVGHQSIVNVPSDPLLRFRVPLAPALDGNTVDPQLEQAAFAESSVRYQASLTFVSDAFRGLMLAITGNGNP